MKNNGLTKRITAFIEKLPIYAIVTLLIGIWFLIFPEKALDISLRISGVVLLLYAIYRLIAVFLLDTDVFESSSSLISTVITLALGMLLVVNPLFVADIISTLFGMYLIVIGVFTLWRSSVMKEHYQIFGIVEDKSNARLRAVTAVISLVLGLVLVIFPLAMENFAAMVTGICLIIDGAKNITVRIIEAVKARRSAPKSDIEVDFIDKSDSF